MPYYSSLYSYLLLRHNQRSSAMAATASSSLGLLPMEQQNNNNNQMQIPLVAPQPSDHNQQSSITPPTTKKKRNQPGNPNPDADIIALSPKSLLEKNRFVCEVCNKGFQREQNLQLHRRGHNLPWKLRQKGSKEVRKKVYLCPEPTCVHHDPTRALGDLTGIKKHYLRKHGEKKHKCQKCAKKYAVHSDWKAHSKICGTKEYRCDCGTLFSRRDSFVTHRAFCDALAQERAQNNLNPRSSIGAHLLPGFSSSSSGALHQAQNYMTNINSQAVDATLQLRKFESLLSPPGRLNDHDHHMFLQQQSHEDQSHQLLNYVPHGLMQLPQLQMNNAATAATGDTSFSLGTAGFFPAGGDHDNSLFSSGSFITNTMMPSQYSGSPSPAPVPQTAVMSATALLQWAAEMGPTITGNTNTDASSSSERGHLPDLVKYSGGGGLFTSINNNNHSMIHDDQFITKRSPFQGIIINTTNNPAAGNHHGGSGGGLTRDFLGVGEIVKQQKQSEMNPMMRMMMINSKSNSSSSPPANFQ
ncbi:zinc finger protein GAI-ASSOCIATED FACTOR 1-like [Andrographis paniculata]|uniref:zinc finger protein GAI-ASSOCIATED FACTOR 1-like n=1 Tax=Andrographis paniculata TaxID=175694 RepID=UPI0021E93027|nr:zinc finger protein GAI-ASSOCIATED FACTOR 1-like [Andrographis paniculata]